MKQKTYIAGLYYRKSQEDERQGESVSIDNQRAILRKYAEEHGFEIHGEYIDDGVSGTTFDRPEVQRLLDDAKTGIINTIIVKDLSRFGRNYIELTREMCYELLDRVVVGGHPKHTGKERVIDIVYKVDIASVLRYKLNK